MTDSQTRTAAVVIDKWKLGIFERHLKQVGYTFTHTEMTPDTWILSVKTTNLEALADVARKANTEAALTKGSST